jgi:hypothetical protein
MCEPKRIGGSDGSLPSRSETGGAHQVHHVTASRDVGVGIRDAAHAVGEGAARGTAELTEGFETLAEFRRGLAAA